MGSAARLVGVDAELSFWSRRRQRSRRGHKRNICTHQSLLVDLWNWSELELEYSRAAEFRSGLVLMTTMNCHLNGLICPLSGFREQVVTLVRVSGVSCVSHDAVRLVLGPRALFVSRATMMFLNVSSVPTSGFFSLPLRHSLSQRCAPGSSMTYFTRSLCATQCPLDDSPRCSGAKILNKTVSGHGV